MNDYPLIADHGLIGDLQTAALVTADGSVDWFCAPRFDSPSIFGSLLDHGNGGHLTLRPVTDDYTSKQLYLPGTAVLITRFMTESGVGEIVDFMPTTSSRLVTERHRIVRLGRCIRGRFPVALDIAPRFDYGRERHETHVTEGGFVFRGSSTALTVNLVREPEDEQLAQPARRRERRRARRVRPGGRPGARARHRDRERGIAPPHARGRDPAAVRRHRRLLEVVDRPVDVHRPLARGPAPLRDHAQADDLRALGRTGRGPDRRAPGADRRRAQLGLPLHLGPGLLLLGALPAGPRLHRGGRRLRAVARCARERAVGQRGGTAQHHVPRRRLLRPQRGDPGALGGLPRLTSGADRERCGRPAAARHLRRGPRQHLRR